MRKAHYIAACQLAKSAFIYQVLPISSTAFAAIASDDTLTLFTVSQNGITTQSQRQNVHKGLTCIAGMGSSIVTGGRDGTVKGFADPADLNPAFELTLPSGKGVSAIAVDAERRMVAVGTEHTEEGPGDVQVYVWLLNESLTQPARSYVDSHTDTITQLLFDPQNPNRLISASTDGLINVFDLSVAEEDDAVEQTINNKTAISHLSLDDSPKGLRILTCISHDEKMSFYELKDEPEESEQSVEPWNLKEGLKCDYAIKLGKEGRSLVLAVGVNKEETAGYRVDLYSIQLDDRLLKGIGIAEAMQPIVRLDGAHGEEVVRDVWADGTLTRLLTAAEDGTVKFWRDAKELDDGPRDSPKKGKRKEKKSTIPPRFAPY